MWAFTRTLYRALAAFLVRKRYASSSARGLAHDMYRILKQVKRLLTRAANRYHPQNGEAAASAARAFITEIKIIRRFLSR